MEISIDFLKKVALEVFNAVHPLLGTAKAAEEIKKGAGGDISLYIDIVAEDLVINALKKANANLLVISEEVGEIYVGDQKKAIESQEKIIMDPIDGSLNSIRGIPYCCISIAYAKGNSLEDINKAVILNLATKDLYWAEKGKGSFLNDKRIKVSSHDLSDYPVFEIDGEPGTLANEMIKYESILRKIYKVRIMGSIALTFCLLASGKIDGFLDFKKYTRLVDMAASYLIVQEAGGKMFSKKGTDLDVKLSMDAQIPLAVSNAKLESFLKKELLKIKPAL